MPGMAYEHLSALMRALTRLLMAFVRWPTRSKDASISETRTVIDVIDVRDSSPSVEDLTIDRESVEQAIRDIDRNFTSVYLTNISIIQGSVFAYFGVVIADHYHELSFCQWSLVLSTAMLYVATWHEYIFTVSLVSWIPTIKDSIGPYALGAAEVALVHAVPEGLEAWSWAGVAFGVVAVLVIFHTNWRLVKDADENRHLLAIIGHMPWFMGPRGALVAASSILVCADCLMLLYPTIGDSNIGRNGWALFSNIVIAGYFLRLGNYRTVFLELKRQTLDRASESNRIAYESAGDPGNRRRQDR